MTESESVALPTWRYPNIPKIKMGWMMGFEPMHAGATILCLNHLTTPTKVTGVPTGIRTPDTRLRRPLLYPAELWAHMERVKGIEPSQSAWEAEVLPLNYTRKHSEHFPDIK